MFQVNAHDVPKVNGEENIVRVFFYAYWFESYKVDSRKWIIA